MQKELPAWVLPTAVGLGVLLLGVIIWRSLAAPAPAAPVGRDIAVRPGMYDMRTEMQKRRPKK
jgi:hypothetical protein